MNDTRMARAEELVARYHHDWNACGCNEPDQLPGHRLFASQLLAKLAAAGLAPAPKLEHAFTIRDMQAGAPILRCANTGCRLVWWPDQQKPRSNCKGANNGGR